MATTNVMYVCVALLCFGVGLASASSCYSAVSYYSYSDGYTKYKTDSTYCLGSQYCCSVYGSYASCCGSYSYITYYTYYSISTAGIAGIVIGTLAGLGTFIAIIVCCCCAACRPGRQQAGQVYLQPGGVGTTVVSTTQNTAMAYPTAPRPMNQPGMIQPYPGGYNPAFVPDTTNQAAYPTTAAVPTTAAPPPPYETKY